MRLFFVVISGMMFFSGLGLAQEDNVTTATSSLQSVLSHLKQSVEKLGLTNDQWAARDKAIKAQVLQLQAQLGRLEAQGALLNKTAAPLRDKNLRRARQIARLEKENSDSDHRIHPPESRAGARRQKEKLKLMKMVYDSQQRQESLHEAILGFSR